MCTVCSNPVIDKITTGCNVQIVYIQYMQITTNLHRVISERTTLEAEWMYLIYCTDVLTFLVFFFFFIQVFSFFFSEDEPHIQKMEKNRRYMSPSIDNIKLLVTVIRY